MKFVSLKFGNRAFSALMALMMSVAIIGCGGDKPAPEGGEKTAPEGAATAAPDTKEAADALKAPETPAPEAEKPMTKETAPAPTKTEPKPEPKKTETPAPALKTSKTPATSSTNLKPEVAVKAWFEGLAKGPRSVWDAFPASYQKDVNGLVHQFSDNMDAEVWDRSIGSIKKLSSILKAKKDILLDPQYLTGAKLEKKEAEAAFDHIVGLLETLTASDVSSLEKMRRFEGGEFLKTTGAQFFTHVEPLANLASAKQGKESKLADIANTKVTLIKSEGDTATLKIEVPGEEPKEKEFVKVEGKWIPADINPEKWKEKMDKARKDLTRLAPGMKENKASALQTLTMLDGFLGKIEKVETKEELQAEVFAIMGPAMQMMQQMQQGAKPATPPASSAAPPKEAPPKATEETKAVEEKKPAATEKKPATTEKKK